ncbi:hypothetical protein [Actinomadura macrotermitis]|uniref:Uncharacterized protein n=1 Tax=Actinomadura macrotermitis TaxID=2585200 RepID=A0A7K0C0K8_9ACTN|nr:hypothetical protein [Actinomadura macrotermitis]MQY07003.1 hypothetical protein [Actinomadura macrotermitis]
MWWLVPAGFVAVLLLYGALADWRARRRGHRNHVDADAAARIREARRDVRVWARGSVGHSGEDVSWMRSFRRGRRR